MRSCLTGMRRGLQSVLVLGILLFAPVSVAASPGPAVVSGASAKVALVPRTVLVDPDGSLTPAEALRRLAAPDAMVEERVFSRGYIPDTVWARVVVETAPAAAGRWYLSLELPNFDRLQVFLVPDPGSDPVPFVEIGDRVPEPTNIRTRYHIAPIDLPAGRTVLLLRGRTGSTMTIDLKLRKLDELLIEEQDFFALQAFYLGIAAIFTLTGIGLFAYMRQTIYLVYIASLMAHTMLWLLINGAGPGHLWPTLARTLHIDPHPFIGLTVWGTAAFSASFLSTVRVPALVQKGLRAVAVLGLALAALGFAVPEDGIYWSHALVSDIVLPIIGVIFGLTAVGLYRGEPAARPLMLTWLGLIGAVVFALLRDIGLIPSNTFTLTGAQLGSVFEMVIFAYMLLTRLGRLQQEKERIQREALAAAREQEAVLERRVADRTVELDAAVTRERAARRLQQQFVAMVSHEFRTPLAIIDGAAQNLQAAESQGSGRLQKIRAAVRRLLRMIDTCLIDDRIDGGAILLQRESVDLGALVQEAVEVIRGAAPDHVVNLEPTVGPARVSADARLIEIAINNLLENAVKYSPAGSTVSVRVEDGPGGVALAVADQGPGVAAADRERIFDKYYRADNTAGTAGSGLGLHLVRAIMTAHGGTATCRAVPPQGSRFVLDFPPEADAVIDDHALPGSAPPAHGGSDGRPLTAISRGL